MLGGNAPPFLRANRPTARAYCSPRKTSSASFSRRDWKRQTGSTALITTDMTARLTSSAAIA